LDSLCKQQTDLACSLQADLAALEGWSPPPPFLSILPPSRPFAASLHPLEQEPKLILPVFTPIVQMSALQPPVPNLLPPKRARPKAKAKLFPPPHPPPLHPHQPTLQHPTPLDLSLQQLPTTRTRR